jgi:hypothetical protein
MGPRVVYSTRVHLLQGVSQGLLYIMVIIGCPTCPFCLGIAGHAVGLY